MIKIKKLSETKELLDIEKKIINLLETKIRPAVARDGGDIKFENYKDGVVQVQTSRQLFRMSKFKNDFKTRCSEPSLSLYS